MAFLRTAAILFLAQLRALARSKRALVCLLLAFGPAAAAVLVRFVAAAKGEPVPAFEIGWLLMVQGTVPLVSLILGAAVVAEEIEDRTLTFLFTRPIPRASVLVGRLLAALVVAWLLLGAGAETAFALLQAGAGGNAEQALPPGMAAAMRNACLMGARVYTTVFAVAGAMFKHPMIVGIGYTFVVEGFVSLLPGSNAKVTIHHHIKSWIAGKSPYFADRMAHLAEYQDLLPAGEAYRTLWTIPAVALALGIWAISRKQYVLPS
jgi:ABC-type transport system involved in multi-copper enzyme maturation permease subunit